MCEVMEKLIDEAVSETLLQNITSLMESFDWSFEAAAEALKLNKEQIEQIRPFINK